MVEAPPGREFRMEEIRGTVRLVEGAPFDVSTRGVTAVLRRSDIEQAARSGDEPAELLLDVRRGQGADVQAHSVAVEWSQADLDRLLREAGTTDEVTIALDRDEMAAAIDAEADVEAHGLREKALVLTVVAVSALSTAGVAQARPFIGSAGGAATTPVASVAAPTPVQSPATTIGGAGAAPIEQVDVVSAAPATITGGATAAVNPAASDSPATNIGGAGVPVTGGAPAEATVSVGASDTPAQAQLRGQAAERTTAIADGSSSLSSAEEAAVLGAAGGLAIAAAGFAAAGTRRRPVRPA
jgi:hypothetical protein